ncbi:MULTISPECIES: hypothetical protein [unclassified Mesorhizobium]|uniref:hypothetical protein n=1 Tax=unclassified Mesorhizobium TaxID=325217 RepID=UPI00333569D6
MKSSFFRAVVFISALFSISGAVAEGSISTLGAIDCGKWVEARSGRKAISFEAYLVGFLDGVAFGSQTEFWMADGRQINAEQTYLWMDKYCRENPLTEIVNGAYKLMDERSRGAFRTKMMSTP